MQKHRDFFLGLKIASFRAIAFLVFCVAMGSLRASAADTPQRPYDGPRTVRQDTFAFTEKPKVRFLGNDNFEITFAVKGYCDATVSIVNKAGTVVRHLVSGVLGANAPAPFQKNTLSQRVVWDGKTDLGEYPKKVKEFSIRVSLGLKPTFDKFLGGKSGRNFPGYIWGIALTKDDAYVFAKGPGSHGHVTLRKFDRNGAYVQTLLPPPSNLSAAKSSGRGTLEVEPGIFAPQPPNINENCSRDGYMLPGANGKGVGDCQPAIAGERIFYCNAGKSLKSGKASSAIHYIYTDGASDVKGTKGRTFFGGAHLFPKLVASPDGKWIYMIGLGEDKAGPAVLRCSVDGKDKAKIFVGDVRKPGSDDKHLNTPSGLDCDAQGRLYISDQSNNRIQIFSPEGKCLKSIKVDRPRLLQVHKKTGAIFVQHAGRKKGKTIVLLTKYGSFDKPTVVYTVEGLATSCMALDSWGAKPRLWMAGSSKTVSHINGTHNNGHRVRIYEESGKTLKLVLDFDKEVKKEAGKSFNGRWSGSIGDKVVTDPVREHLYYRNSAIFDLNSGNKLGRFSVSASSFDDIAFDGRGFMHVHFNPGFEIPGVGRTDPSRKVKQKDRHGESFYYPEVPYDYGVQKTARWKKHWKGMLPTKCQPGAKFFQDGIGVNQRGDVAVESNIYFVPRMAEVGWNQAVAGISERRSRGEYIDGSMGGAANNYGAYMKKIREKQKRGEEVYFIKRKPGISLAGATVWTFDSTGEIRGECAVSAGRLIGGVMLDTDFNIYFAHNRPRVLDGRPFLANCARINGIEKAKPQAFIGTFIKAREGFTVVLSKSPIQLDPLPKKPQDLRDPGGMKAWANNAEWLYAGASPLVAGGCSCPSMRSHVDWYRRSFVPEAYRHSIGILDTAGNLIMHLGKYGNTDDALRMQQNKNDIRIVQNRFVTGTDKHLVFEDFGERLVVLKMDYHVEAEAAIQLK